MMCIKGEAPRIEKHRLILQFCLVPLFNFNPSFFMGHSELCDIHARLFLLACAKKKKLFLKGKT